MGETNKLMLFQGNMSLSCTLRDMLVELDVTYITIRAGQDDPKFSLN
jgi:hypothetical protein